MAGGREPLAEVGQQRQVGRQVGDRLAQQGGRGLTGGHEHQGYAARNHAGAAPMSAWSPTTPAALVTVTR